MRVVVTRIDWDGTMRRRMVDTVGRIDGARWEELAVRALAISPPYRPVPRMPVYHVSVDDAVVQVAEHDLAGALLDLITAVLALGEELLSSAPRGLPLTFHRLFERQSGQGAKPCDRPAGRRTVPATPAPAGAPGARVKLPQV